MDFSDSELLLSLCWLESSSSVLYWRISWTTLEDDHVVFRVEVRGGDGAYAMRREYGMRRE